MGTPIEKPSTQKPPNPGGQTPPTGRGPNRDSGDGWPDPAKPQLERRDPRRSNNLDRNMRGTGGDADPDKDRHPLPDDEDSQYRPRRHDERARPVSPNQQPYAADSGEED